MWLGFDSHEAVYLLLLRGTCTRLLSLTTVCALYCALLTADGSRWRTFICLYGMHFPWLCLGYSVRQRRRGKRPGVLTVKIWCRANQSDALTENASYFGVLLLFSHVAAAFTACWVKVRRWTYSCRLMRQDGILTQGRIPCTCGAWRKTCYLPPVVL